MLIQLLIYIMYQIRFRQQTLWQWKLNCLFMHIHVSAILITSPLFCYIISSSSIIMCWQCQASNLIIRIFTGKYVGFYSVLLVCWCTRGRVGDGFGARGVAVGTVLVHTGTRWGRFWCARVFERGTRDFENQGNSLKSSGGRALSFMKPQSKFV